MTSPAWKQRAIGFLGVIWGLAPRRIRGTVLRIGLRLEARGAGGLDNLLLLSQPLEEATSDAAMRAERGVHPKHRVMRYHDFFVDRIVATDVVVDIGCGYGAVANSIAERTGAEVFGIDLDGDSIAQARSTWRHPSLHFVQGDALAMFPTARCDVVVLSNVLEHVEHRVELLRRILAELGPRAVLIRVPLYDRHWTVAFRQERGLPYFSDPTHFVEHTAEGWIAEISSAGLRVTEHDVRWGEAWCACVPA